MNEEKNKPLEISISKNNNYEGKHILDYIISSMDETKIEIKEIHNDISYKNNNTKNNENIKEKNEEINDKFNKVFKNNENNMNLFEYINNINKNHIKKYKSILNFLNLNIIFDKNNEKKENQNKVINNNESNFNNSSLHISEINNRNKIEETSKGEENKNKNDSLKIIEKYELDSNDNKYK